LSDEVDKFKSMSADLGKKKNNLEAQLADAQSRLKEATAKAADLSHTNTKLQVCAPV
jgi:hypothetical protein